MLQLIKGCGDKKVQLKLLPMRDLTLEGTLAITRKKSRVFPEGVLSRGTGSLLCFESSTGPESGPTHKGRNPIRGPLRKTCHGCGGNHTRDTVNRAKGSGNPTLRHHSYKDDPTRSKGNSSPGDPGNGRHGNLWEDTTASQWVHPMFSVPKGGGGVRITDIVTDVVSTSSIKLDPRKLLPNTPKTLRTWLPSPPE